MATIPQLTEEQYSRNFSDINPPLTDDAARDEANRCLFCYDAPCTKACPTHINVPFFIKKIATRNLKGSAWVILEANILGYSCARLCPVEVLCEGACVFNEKKEKPIEIALLQRYATDYVFDRGIHKQLFKAGKSNGKKIAVIGSGPAGLSCAAEAIQLGYDVTIYDRNEAPGGLDTFGIARYKMTINDPLKEIDLVKSLGVKFIQNCTIGKDKSMDELMKENNAIFIGIGLGQTEELGIPGENIPGVWDALTWIHLLKTKKFGDVPIGRKVAVIGGGNTAIDAVTQAKRLGAEEVYMVYRRSQKEMPAYHYEYELAKKDEIITLWQTAPVRVIGKEKVSGLECIKMRMGNPDASGRRSPEPIKGSEFVLETDMIIKALGQKKYVDFLSQIPGLKTDTKGRVQIDSKTFQTGNLKVFAGGDCVNGGKEVVNAVWDGKQAARGIDQYIKQS